MQLQPIHEAVFNLLMDYHERDEQFMFAMRQLNRNGRLDRGYWFHGNDDYVAVSFWRGSDNLTKTPRIAFIILTDGSTYLEINVRNSSSGYLVIPPALLSALGLTNSKSNNIIRKYYSAYSKDYLESLKAFVQGDKKVIDTYVRDWELSTTEPVAYGESIGMIWPAEFNKNLKIVLKYVKIRTEKEKKKGYLRSFHIKRFGPIRNIAIAGIPDGCRWIFLTGENGAGKTTMLRALAAALSNNNDHGEEVAKNYKDFVVKIVLDKLDGFDGATIRGSNDYKDKRPLPKGLAVYGPVRLLTQGSLGGDLAKLDEQHISHQTTYGLFNPIGILRDISGSYVLGVKPKYYEMTLSDFLENIEKNLAEILPNVFKTEITEEGKGHQILYYQGDGSKPEDIMPTRFEHLPSGTRNLAALILDLLLRFSEQQQGVSDIADFVGIVLIDEIDLHLHPKMQKEIVVQLSETFPNIQFIVTTHSPIPMLGAPKNSTFINVHRKDNHQICATKLDIDVSNLLPNAILTSPIFDFEELINVHHDPSERLVTEDDYNEAVFYKILERKIRARNNNINPENDSPAT